MVDCMEYTCGITGIAHLQNKHIEKVTQQVKEATQQAIHDGYKYFWLAMIGPSSVHYAAGAKDAMRGYDGLTLEVLIPFHHWHHRQLQPEQFKQLVSNSSGFLVATNEPTDNFVMITNNQVLDLATRMIVINDNKDPETLSILKIINAIEMPVNVITLS